MQDTNTNQVTSITDSEKQMISDMLAKRQLLLAQAESALAKNQLAELEHKNLILQLFLKYGLNPSVDMIDENGNIVRNEKVSDQ